MADSDPEASPLFTPWRDPRSGVVSHLPTTRCAQWHQNFYFTNNGVADGGRLLPRFVLDDEWIAYTTTVRPGRLDYALVRVADLVQ